jgi:hypothetical protein
MASIGTRSAREATQALELPEIMNGTRSKARELPGHFIPILASSLERTAWWQNYPAHKKSLGVARAQTQDRARERGRSRGPINLSNALAFRFASSFADKIDACCDD